MGILLDSSVENLHLVCYTESLVVVLFLLPHKRGRNLKSRFIWFQTGEVDRVVERGVEVRERGSGGREINPELLQLDINIAGARVCVCACVRVYAHTHDVTHMVIHIQSHASRSLYVC